MKKILFITLVTFVLVMSVAGCGANTPTATPLPTQAEGIQPTYTSYPTQILPTPYPTQAPPTAYPTQAPPTAMPPTPVPYHPSGDSAKNVLLANGFKDEGDGNFVYAATSDMYIKVMIFSTGGFRMYILYTGYIAHSDLIAKIITGFINGGELSYDMAGWLLSNIPDAANKPVMKNNIYILEDTIYTNNNGVDFIELIALPTK